MQENDLKHLPSYEFYDGFNKKNDLCNSVDHCKKISEHFHNNERIREICNMLIANIFYFRDKHTDNTPFFHKHCYDLNYWLYDQLSTFRDQNNKNITINSTFTEFSKVWRSFIEKELLDGTNSSICMPEPKFYEKKLIKHLKDLFDYAENYKRIENEITKSSEKPKIYCSYILGKVHLYFMGKKLCSSGESDRCTTYIGNYKQYDPSTLLSQLSCLGGEIGNIPIDKDLITEVLKFQESIPNFVIPDLSKLTDLQGEFMKSLEGLMKNGFASIGIESLFNVFPSLSDILNSDVFKQYIMPSLYGTGSLILFFILYKVNSKYILKYEHFKTALIVYCFEILTIINYAQFINMYIFPLSILVQV
ncbi:variable surface protein Vir14 [Plasmodium vivax Brazil I]|uniref:Variable surface protein Vir14 n=1 Tax=Plasmodium vivax (strain Brazil I) TaxID=1033975 RepID=A0A0J9SS52_PLAV1|nr:variable surface protein Vir14 [Plasmodium vivax Brazil I]